MLCLLASTWGLMMSKQMDLLAGRALRDEALSKLESTTRRQHYIARCREFLIEFAMANGKVSSDDVRSRYPIPEEWDGRIMGAVFSPRWLKKMGFVKCGEHPTKFKQAHTRPQSDWRLA